MHLRAVSVSGDFVYFSITDCPVIINERAVILLNRPNSPILQLRSIARGTDDDKMFEGDFVLDCQYNVVGYVVYNKGFKVSTPKGELIPFKEDFKVLFNATTQLSNEVKSNKSMLTFVFEDTSFTLHSIVTCDRDVGYLFSKNLKSIDLSNVKFATGFKFNGRDLCYGDVMEDGVIVLHELHPMVKTQSGFRELRSDEYD